MHFRILGPLRVWDGTAWAPISAPQRRSVLAILLAEAGREVSAARLVAQLWGGRPPRAAVSTVHGHVMRLRRQIGAHALLTRRSGYEIAADDDAVDSAMFERLVAAGRRALLDGRRDQAAADLRRGLALWQGTAFEDVPMTSSVSDEVGHLERIRLTAVEQRFGLELDLGRHVTVVDELDGLTHAHPLREGMWRLHMLALYRSGRRVEALEAYRRACRALAAQRHVAPGSMLQDLERAILADDPAIERQSVLAEAALTGAHASDTPPVRSPGRRPPRRPAGGRRLLAGGAARTGPAPVAG